jgi:DNA-binding MarR family transcriptional regulator
MADRLRGEIKQRRPFASVPEEAMLNILRTADTVQRLVAEVLKPLGLTLTQYNALRILRGAGDEGRACSEIGERLVTRDPDVTRLLDRLDARGLIARDRSAEDRRVVRSRITEQGLALLDEAEGPVRALQQRLFEPFGKEQISALIEALEAVRSGSR